MYTIAVCDDEASILKLVSDTVTQYFKKNHIQVAVDCFDQPEALRKSLKRNTCYDVLLMDIDMPGLNGIDICKEYRQMGGNALVVFISNKEELVFQTFDVQPFRFVRKRRFHEEIEHLCKALIVELEKRADVSLRFDNEVDGTVLAVSINKLIYVEARGKTCILRMADRSEEVRVRFQDMMERLKDFSFIQTHRSYLVNPRFIYRIGKDSILLDGGEELPLSRRRREQIKEDYFRWSRGQ